MTQATLKEKIFDIEKKLEILKKAIKKEPDFDIDEKNWKKIEPIARKTRKKMHEKYYSKKK